MNDQEQALADRIYAAMQDYSINSDRGLQAKEFRVGISDLGYCSERLRRMLDRQSPEDTDMLKAFIGTAIGKDVEAAVVKAEAFPDAVSQIDVVLTLDAGDGRVFNIPGHPDLILPDEGIVLDVKTSQGLALAERLGADQQKNFQRMGYGKAVWDAGYFGDRPLEEVQVGNVWIDRSGDQQRVHVQLVPFDPDVIASATAWLDDVIYNFRQGTEAMKEPPREVCAATCGFFRICRARDTDVEGLLTAPEVLEAIDMYREGVALEKQGRSLKSQAKPALVGYSGSTGKATLRWVHVNESTTAATVRKAHDKIDIREIR